MVTEQGANLQPPGFALIALPLSYRSHYRLNKPVERVIEYLFLKSCNCAELDLRPPGLALIALPLSYDSNINLINLWLDICSGYLMKNQG